jgi:hypothetical protein
MGILTNIANGLGTVLGVLSVAASDVISEIRTAYNNFRKVLLRTANTKRQSEEERTKEELRTVNDEILYLRNRRMSGRSLYRSRSSALGRSQRTSGRILLRKQQGNKRSSRRGENTSR